MLYRIQMRILKEIDYNLHKNGVKCNAIVSKV